MPQQINLYTPVLLTQRRTFSAQAMAVAAGVFAVGLAALGATLAWRADEAQAGLEAARRSAQADRERLAAALGKAPKDGGTDALQQELDGLRAEARRLARQRDALAAGLVREGRSHSAVLRSLSRTVPAAVWLREVRVDAGTLALTGYTLDPAVLHGWIGTLQNEPALGGRPLKAIKVQQQPADAAADGSAPAWLFTLDNGGRP